jgi:hypothetical protein
MAFCPSPDGCAGPFGYVPGPAGPVYYDPYGCGPCPPLISGVGKCLPPCPPTPCSWEIDKIVVSTGTNGNLAYTVFPFLLQGVRTTSPGTAVTSFTVSNSGAISVVYNLQQVRGSTCSLLGRVSVTHIEDDQLITKVYETSATVHPYTTTVTLTFPAIDGADQLILYGKVVELSTRFC